MSLRFIVKSQAPAGVQKRAPQRGFSIRPIHKTDPGVILVLDINTAFTSPPLYFLIFHSNTSTWLTHF